MDDVVVVGDGPTEQLVRAVMRSDVDGVRHALAAGGDVFGVVACSARFYRDYGMTALHLVLAGKAPRVAGDVLGQIPDGAVNRHITGTLFDLSEGEAGLTMLHVAMERRNVKAVELLLSMGASLDIKNNDGETPLAYALYSSRFGGESIETICEIAFDAGYLPTCRDFCNACRGGVSDAVCERLLDLGADRIPDELVGQYRQHPLVALTRTEHVNEKLAKRIILSPNYRNIPLEGYYTVFAFFANRIVHYVVVYDTDFEFLGWLLSAGFNHMERCADGRNYRESVHPTDVQYFGANIARINAVIDKWDQGTHPIQLEQQAVAASLTSLPVELAGMVGDFVAMTQERRAAEKRQSE